MATTTQVQGYLYNAQGTVLTTGKLYITLQQDMVLDGQKIAPTKVTVDLSVSAGYVNVGLYPTATASPTGITYFVEFDPDPTDTSKPMSAKTGYFSNFWSIPATTTATIGSFPVASRTSQYYSYLDYNSRAIGYLSDLRVVTANTTLLAGDNGAVVWINTGTARTITLPVPAAGMHFTVVVGLAGTHAVHPGPGVSINGFGLTKTNSPLTSAAGAAGNFVRLVAANSTTWYVAESRGSWT